MNSNTEFIIETDNDLLYSKQVTKNYLLKKYANSNEDSFVKIIKARITGILVLLASHYVKIEFR